MADKSKNIWCYAVGGLVIAFVVFTVFYWWPKDYKGAINSVLEQDHIAYQNKTSKADYVRRMRAIDLDDCPEDFKKAFRDHITAHAGSDTANNVGIGSIIIGMLGSIFTANPIPLIVGIGAGGASTAAGVADIHTTWEQVKKVAAKYGAKPPSD